VLLTVLPDQLDLCRVICIICKNAKFRDNFLELSSTLCHMHVNIRELGDVIVRFKGSYLVKILKEKNSGV